VHRGLRGGGDGGEKDEGSKGGSSGGGKDAGKGVVELQNNKRRRPA